MLADLVLWVVVLALNQTVALPLVVRPKGRVTKPANDPGMTFVRHAHVGRHNRPLSGATARWRHQPDHGHRSAVDESGCSTCPTH